MNLMNGYEPQVTPMSEQNPVDIPPQWDWREHPPTLSRRFQFSGYNQTRYFLEELATLAEECGYYPDTNFGVNYVNVTIHGRDGVSLQKKDFIFAARINELTSLLRTPKK